MAEATTVATPYTSEQGANQDRLTTLANEIQKGYSDLPSMKTQIAQEVSSQEGLLKPLQEDKGKLIQQLFEHDKNYANTYASPTSAQFIENPMARSAGQTASSAPIWGAISNLQSDITSRRAILGDAITNAIEARKAELVGKKTQLDSLTEIYKQQLAYDLASGELTQVDLGDRIAFVDRFGKEVSSLPKKASEDILALISKTDDLQKTISGLQGGDEASTTVLNPEAISKNPETVIEEVNYGLMNDNDKMIFLRDKRDRGYPLTVEQQADYTRLLNSRTSPPAYTSEPATERLPSAGGSKIQPRFTPTIPNSPVIQR